jgi:hypothetical protein
LCFGVERVKQHLEKIEGVVKYGQFRDASNIGSKTQNTDIPKRTQQKPGLDPGVGSLNKK